MGILNAALKFLPFILTLIPSVESLFQKGSDKKAAVLNSSNSVMSILVGAGVVTQDEANKFPDATSELVDDVVKFLNAVGAFPKSTATK